jgi:hypothetical protein
MADLRKLNLVLPLPQHAYILPIHRAEPILIQLGAAAHLRSKRESSRGAGADYMERGIQLT